MIDDQTLDELFTALGAHLAEAQCPIAILVVGGATLAARRLVERTTKDVDVIAQVSEEAGLLKPSTPVPFPEPLQKAIHRVARDFGLPRDWMNNVVGNQWKIGPPPNLMRDVEWRQYDALKVGLVGRQTLVTLKFFAAVDHGTQSVHWQDLVTLAPSSGEIDEAVSWVQTQDAGMEFSQFVDQAEEQLRNALAKD